MIMKGLINMSGSIQDRKNGSYLLTYSMGFKADGTRARKTRTVKAKNITEAKKMLAAFVTEIEQGEYIDPSKMTFGAIVKEWREKYAERNLSSGTIEVYDYYLTGHMLPEFSHRPLDKIIPMHITDYLIGLEKSRKDGKEGGLAPATVQKHYNLLSSIFQFAKRNGLIKNNPVENAERPVVRKTETDVYTTEEVHELFKLLEKEEIQHNLMIRLAIETGMRRGELLGLQWEDIDFERNKISIRHSLSYTKEEGYQLGDTKSRKKRVVIASRGMMDRLKNYHLIKRKERLQSSELWEGGSCFFVFSDWNGKPLYPGSPTRWWSRFLERTEFKKIRFHDLRHTAATLLINQGLHAKIISERLGHADISTTMNVYGHYLEEADQKAADILDNLFGNIN